MTEEQAERLIAALENIAELLTDFYMIFGSERRMHRLLGVVDPSDEPTFDGPC